MEKVSVLNDVEREKFRLELNREEYDCYSNHQKDMIMRAIRYTNWDLSFVRLIFQSDDIKRNINDFLHILLSVNSKYVFISDFGRNLVKGISKNLQSGIDYSLAAKLVDQFISDYLTSYTSNNYYSSISEKRIDAIFKYSYDVLFNDEYRKLLNCNVMKIFESLVKSY